MAHDILENIQITPRQVKELLDRRENVWLVDVREKWEYNTAHLEGSTLIPLGEIPANLARLERADQVVCFCHLGRRSLDAAAWLRSQGVEGARSMAGGIDRWSTEVDSGVARY
jgi:rhodanese-related sulfurtransferase